METMEYRLRHAPVTMMMMGLNVKTNSERKMDTKSRVMVARVTVRSSRERMWLGTSRMGRQPSF